MANYACKVRGCKASGFRSVGALGAHTTKAHPARAAAINRKRVATRARTMAGGGLPTKRRTANPGRTRTALRFCVNCGTRRARTWKFCGRCGVKCK